MGTGSRWKRVILMQSSFSLKRASIFWVPHIQHFMLQYWHNLNLELKLVERSNP
jgi:hypothetical protein